MRPQQSATIRSTAARNCCNSAGLATASRSPTLVEVDDNGATEGEAEGSGCSLPLSSDDEWEVIFFLREYTVCFPFNFFD